MFKSLETGKIIIHQWY